MSTTTEFLDGVLKDQINIVSMMADGSEERASATKDIEAMSRAYAEHVKADAELRKVEYEAALAEETAKSEARDRIVTHVANGVKFVALAALVVGSTAIGYKFEETGAQTSQTFKRVQDWVWKFTKM